MKRSTFFKSLFGLALLPVASQFKPTEIKANQIEPKELKNLKPIKLTGQSSDRCFIIPDKNDFKINGKEIKDIRYGEKVIAIQFDQEIYAVEPMTLTYNNHGLSKS